MSSGGTDEPGRAMDEPSYAMSGSQLQYTMANAQQLHPFVQSSLPFVNLMNFGSVNFDGVTLPDTLTMQHNGFDDWVWDTVMDDFAMPSL